MDKQTTYILLFVDIFIASIVIVNTLIGFDFSTNYSYAISSFAGEMICFAVVFGVPAYLLLKAAKYKQKGQTYGTYPNPPVYQPVTIQSTVPAKYCVKCGAAINYSGNFCMKCGSRRDS